ncbi:MAG: dioxygenase, partial [Microbacterium sp.]|nr:dioxygenase [Microbacterium sp.]
MAAGGKSRDERVARERARAYAARRALHEASRRRRVRDNTIAAVAGGILILLLAAGQFAYYSVGPGAP